MYKLVGLRNLSAYCVYLWAPAASVALAHSAHKNGNLRLIHTLRYLPTQLVCVAYDLNYATVNRIWTAPHV